MGREGNNFVARIPYLAYNKAMLKATLHTHLQGDHDDYIGHTGFELLDYAKKLNFDVVAFSAHERVIITEDLKQYARSLDILLIPGIEINLGGHVLILNAHPETQYLKTLEDLRSYRLNHPEIFIIAAHPFFPQSSMCLQLNAHRYIDVFDGIEQSWFYTEWFNFNKKAESLAKQHNLPYIATSDVHILEMLHLDYVFIDAEKSIEAVFEAMRSKRFYSISYPKSLFQMIKIFAKMNLVNAKRYLPWSPPHFIFDHERISRHHQSQSQTKPKANYLSRGI
ncbi:TPA: hypothetical protein DGH83_04705 [Candidatus Peregrinibacteria bacterium]|nr:hypothetical protein [Candidatus Peregrinibacteria bacterium]